MNATISGVEVQIYGYNYTKDGLLYCRCRVPYANQLIDVLAELIEVGENGKI